MKTKIRLAMMAGIAALTMTLTPVSKADAFSLSIGGRHGGFGLSIGHGHRGHGHQLHLGGFSAHRSRHHRHEHVVVVPAPPSHVCYQRPVVERVWVAPVYDTVFVGYDACGRAVHERRIIRSGYYTDRVVRFETCAHLH